MAVTAYKFPGTASQADFNSQTAWTNPSNIQADDGNDASVGFSGLGFIYKYVHLVKGGVVQTGNNEGGTGAPFNIMFTNPRTFGGASDLWGETGLTAAEVNASDFGVAIAVGDADGDTDLSDYLIATNFDFDLPLDATIDGIEIEIDAVSESAGGGVVRADVDYIKMRIHYTWSPTLEAVGQANGFCYVAPFQRQRGKRFRYLVYDKFDVFLGELNNVPDDPSFQQDINNLHTSKKIVAQQNESSPGGVGPGTVIEVNNNVRVVAFYGYLQAQTDGNGVVVLDGDNNPTIQEVGYPNGKTIWTGWVSEFELDYGSGDNVMLNMLSHSQELRNIMLETEDSTEIVSNTPDSNSLQLVGVSGNSSDPTRAAQVITAPSTFKCGRITIPIRNDFQFNSGVRLTVRNGSNPASPGSVIAVADATLPYDPNSYPTTTDIEFVFPSYINFTNAASYILFLDSPDTSKTGGGGLWPANVLTGTGYSGGSAWRFSPAGGWVNTSSRDFLFTVWEVGGATTVTFNSYDPAQMLRDALDFARSRGAKANYTTETIPLTGTTVSYTFKANTIDEVFAKVLELCPSDWYGYYDPGTNLVYLQPRPEEVAHRFIKGKDIESLKIKRTLVKLINDVYFTGGGDPALFKRTTDATSMNQWRRGLAKPSDNRVTDSDTAVILSQSQIDRFKDPLHAGMLSALPIDFAVEDVLLGQVIGFMGCGDFTDALELQIVSRTYKPDTVECRLDVLLPPVSKRIEDIKRNLNVLEQQNNPSSPS